MDTKTVAMTGTDENGNTVTIPVTIPVALPSNERAEYLRSLWRQHVKSGQDWKGPCYANVPKAIANDVAEAMDFMGAIVDDRWLCEDGETVAMFSQGYRAHGF